MEKIEVQMLLYTLIKKFIEIKKNMLNVHLVSYCFIKQCSGLIAKTLVWSQRNQSSIPFTNIYYVEYVYLYIYFVHMCKCIVFWWVVDREVGGYDRWVSKYLLFIYL
jgi:hypothetical protein